ncbi:MAG: hypothetical protein QW794_03180 [Thermosphaera sp.]
MNEKTKTKFDICRYGLYNNCLYFEVTGIPPKREDCSLCIKTYRLKTGLVTRIEYRIKGEGTRVGVSL